MPLAVWVDGQRLAGTALSCLTESQWATDASGFWRAANLPLGKRDFLLLGEYQLGLSDLVVPFVTLVVFVLSMAFFRRFSTHFEDFL